MDDLNQTRASFVRILFPLCPPYWLSRVGQSGANCSQRQRGGHRCSEFFEFLSSGSTTMFDIELDPEPMEPFIELDPENLCDEFGPASTEPFIELEPEELDLAQVCAEFGPDCQVEIELEPEDGLSIVPPVEGCIELDEEELLPPAAFEDAWVPGKDVGRHIHKGVRPIQEQSQIILVNLVRTCMALPSAVLREIIDKLPPLKFSNDSSTGRYFFKAASRLCRLLLLPCQFIFYCVFRDSMSCFMLQMCFIHLGGCVNNQALVPIQ